MSVNGLVKATVPVVIGVVVAGYVMNMFRTSPIIYGAISGYDS